MPPRYFIPFFDINIVILIRIPPIIFLRRYMLLLVAIFIDVVVFRWWPLAVVVTILVVAIFVDAIVLLRWCLLVAIVTIFIDVVVLL
jgi:hypothetical protein